MATQTAVELAKVRNNKIAFAEVDCSVDGQSVSSAELMLAILDEPEVG